MENDNKIAVLTAQVLALHRVASLSLAMATYSLGIDPKILDEIVDDIIKNHQSITDSASKSLPALTDNLAQFDVSYEQFIGTAVDLAKDVVKGLRRQLGDG